MSNQGHLLAIETSCDECAAAVVEESGTRVKVRSSVVFSQIDLHRRFGGVVPEVASRNHLDMLSVVIDEALEKAGLRFNDLKAVGVTNGPGLIGALLVGVSSAKALAYSLGKPLISVNHLEGHLHSLFIAGQSQCDGLNEDNLPLLVCLVSGGHTNLYLLEQLPPHALGARKLSESRDDAAGEAFDKCAKLLGLPYPGGIHLDRLAKTGNARAYAFPRPMPGKTLEFSFSGLKTAVATRLTTDGYEPHVRGDANLSKLPTEQVLANYCASVQEAIVDSLQNKISLALEQTGARGLAVVGGVSANSRLREVLSKNISVPVFYPDLKYCTDNAAMIGACAAFKFARGEVLSTDAMLKLNAFSS